MKSNEIRARFLEFFRSKDHEIVPSDTLVPRNDPTLLFTSAGMNQFKDQFMGKHITYKRAASCQKCLRTQDLEKVGKTSGHHTFFEMLGNFSFGDYFKEAASRWAWEFMTEVLNVPKERLWISVYKEDDEAYGIWSEIGIPEEKVVRLDARENFWPANAPEDGPNGPCGPCSEIFYDWGKDTGCRKKTCDPSCDCGRFVEVWNLVFTQFNRVGKNKLEPLPSKNIDTGMGLERITAVMQGVKTNFQTDLFSPIIQKLKTYPECRNNLRITSGSRRNSKEENFIRDNLKLKTNHINAIADHIRAATFAIGDEIAPSNEERGYVVRKLIRRAYLLSKANEPFLYNLVPKIISVMQDAYSELRDRREDIASVIKEEEEKFQNTLSASLPKLEEVIVKFRKQRKLPGEQIFKLVDTYGLPLEVIEGRTKKAKYILDLKGFQACMKKQKELSRGKSKIEADIFVEDIFSKSPKPPTSSEMPLRAEIVQSHAMKGDIRRILTSPQSSAFYTEAGGQVGDSGVIKDMDGSMLAKIVNTYNINGRIVHECKVERQLTKGEKVTVELDKERKREIARNHTATHLLHSALRKVLGGHVRQSGSLVDDKRLRFDFTHMKKLTERELERIEGLVNEKIKEAIEVEKKEKTKEDAEKEGAIALFGEKYGQKVRVVAVSDYSKELCGGTHVDNTNEIGMFKIIRESSIASGMRRIEALTGERARKWVEENDKLKIKNEKLKKEKEEEKRLIRERLKTAEEKVDLIIKKGKTIKGATVITEEIKDANLEILRKLSDKIESKEKSAFIMLATSQNHKVFLILSITKDLVDKGLDAGSMIKEIARVIGGSGGGRKDFAQAGGKGVAKIGQALKKSREVFVECAKDFEF